MQNPKITVIMPVYNAEEYLREAIDSILSQTFTDFEFLIFNDGSTDRSAEIIQSYQDPRINLYDSSFNSGHVAHLNQGINLAHGQYIARMDADDISHFKRFEKQVAFMDANPSVGVCGTWFDIIGQPKIAIEHPENHDKIRLALLDYCALGHPTVFIRTKIFRKYKIHYDKEFVPAEDYHLWTILAEYCHLHNLQEVLLYYRVHDKQISSRKQHVQIEKTQLVRNLQIETLLERSITQEEVNLLRLLIQLKSDPISREIEKIVDIEKLVKCLISANQKANTYLEPEFSNLLIGKLSSLRQIIYFHSYIASDYHNLRLLKDFWFSPLKPSSYFSKRQNIAFTIKCLLNWQKQSL